MSQIDKEAWRAALKVARLSQNKAAKAVGMSTISLSRKVLGRREFTISEMVRLSLLLNIKDPLAIFAPELKELGGATPSSVGKSI